MRHLEQLMLTVGLVDQVTRPIQGVQQQIQQTGEIASHSWQRIAGGAAGALAAGAALHQALMPAIEMDRVLGEVKSLGVLQEDLDQLNRTATDFAIEFGKSATEFVGAAYDIKSAMGDMSGQELSGITRASAVLAAATKADTATITGYMGTMYGLFKQQAEAMGKDNFAAMVAGQTAQAVEMFKTTGAEMSAAFTSVGATAVAAGIDVAEQMAVLGTLQATMSGSEAGTKYKAFVNGVAGAQDKLNMSFTDANGNMLGMVDILQKLKDQFGDTLTVAESDALKKAFGSDEAVMLIKQMLPDIDSLAASVNSVGQQTGMDKATEMASAMTDQWQRLGAVWEALRRGAGESVLGGINSAVGGLVDQLAILAEWTKLFPNLTRAITWTIIAIGGITAAAALWGIVAGVAGLAMGALTWPILAVAAAVAGLVLLWEPLSAFFGGIAGALGDQLPTVFAPLLGLFDLLMEGVGWLAGGLASLLPGMEGLGGGFITLQGLGESAGFIISSALMMIFNPLEFIRRSIGWLGDAWAALVAFFAEGEFMAPVRADFARLEPVIERMSGLFDLLRQGWEGYLWALRNLHPFKLVTDAFGWLLDKLSLLPDWITSKLGLDVEASAAVEQAAPATAPALPAPTQQVTQQLAPATVPALPASTQQVTQQLAPAAVPSLPASTQQVTQQLAPAVVPSLPASTQQVTQQLVPATVPALPASTQQVDRQFGEINTTLAPATQAVTPELGPMQAQQRTVPVELSHSAPPGAAANTPQQQEAARVKLINQRLQASPGKPERSAPPIGQQLGRATGSGGRVVQFGDVHITNQGGMNPDQLAEWEELQYGY